MDLIKKLEEKANVEMIKYLCSKQIWCGYSNGLLDYRNAIMVEIKYPDGNTQSKVIDGVFRDRINEIREAFEGRGLQVVITKNITKN